ncbi:hypothetical protein BDZ89DRAFT_406712 [Hymenopellis radicata]|nr:hypothetical protein BDZ89DRAFT_406712 [Hymenopellis radicata]
MGVALGTLRDHISSALPCELRSSLPLPPPQSAAQRCNDDVLFIIFEDLRPRDLHSVALTCKGWTPAAYRALYASVFFRAYYGEGTRIVELLSRTLIASADIRSLVRHLSVNSLDSSLIVGRPEPDPLYDWLPLLPHNTISSLLVGTAADEHFISQLMRSPMLQSVQHLGLGAAEAWFIGRNRMSELLTAATSLSQVAVYLPRPSFALILPPSDFYAPFSPLPCRIRHLTVSMWAFTPLLADLLRAAQNSLESLHCTVTFSHFHEDLRRALEITFASPLRTLHVYSSGMLPNTLLVTRIPDTWVGMRELVFPGFIIPSNLFQSLPTSLETLGLGLFSFEPFPFREIEEFIERAAELHLYFRRLIIFGVNHLKELNDLPRICSECGVSLQPYKWSMNHQSLANPDGGKLETLLESLSLTTK